jgi:BirA family biotin operon repressor/biotin-[acetyl-CoA-carboxylase] ligase
MINLDAGAIRESLGEAAAARLSGFDAFAEIDSTNTYLMQRDGPQPGRFHVAATTNQTMGRGRHGRTWQSPPGSGLCLSLAYSFGVLPPNLSALTLAIGIGVIDALEEAGVGGVQLKWPNDLMADDGKLGGILTESQSRVSGAVTIVTGVGLNVDLGDFSNLELDKGSVRQVADLAGCTMIPPTHDDLAARLIDNLCATFVNFEADGFERYARRWVERDWLLGRDLVIDTQQRQVAGTGAGIAEDGALLVDTGEGGVHRITSGSVVLS